MSEPTSTNINYDELIAAATKRIADSAKRAKESADRFAAAAKIAEQEQQRIAEENQIYAAATKEVEELKRVKRQKLDQEVSIAGKEYESVLQLQTKCYVTMSVLLIQGEELAHKAQQSKQTLEQITGSQNLSEYVTNNSALFTPSFANSIKEKTEAGKRFMASIERFTNKLKQ